MKLLTVKQSILLYTKQILDRASQRIGLSIERTARREKQKEKKAKKIQVKELTEQLNQIDSLFNVMISLGEISSHMEDPMYPRLSHQLTQLSRLDRFENTFQFLHRSPLATHFMPLYQDGSFFKKESNVVDFYLFPRLGIPVLTSRGPVHLGSLLESAGIVKYKKDFLVGKNHWRTEHNTFIPHLFFFLSYLYRQLKNEDHQPILMKHLMQNKDILSLLARLIQLSKDIESADAFFRMEEFAHRQVEKMFAPVESFVTSVEDEVSVLEKAKLAEQHKKERLEKVLLEQKVSYYTKDSLNIDKTSVSEDALYFVEKAEALFDNKEELSEYSRDI